MAENQPIHQAFTDRFHFLLLHSCGKPTGHYQYGDFHHGKNMYQPSPARRISEVSDQNHPQPNLPPSWPCPGLVRLHFLHLRCRCLQRLWGLGSLGHEVSELRLQALHDLAGVHVLPRENWKDLEVEMKRIGNQKLGIKVGEKSTIEATTLLFHQLILIS